MEKSTAIRILQLKNNFLRDVMDSKKEQLGKYCVLGYFDAFDISDDDMAEKKSNNSWQYLGKLTSELAGKANCRMLICFTEDKEKDKSFWKEEKEPLFFITMVRLKKEKACFEEQKKIKEELDKKEKSICYWSYDHSEIIVVTKTKRYSEGIQKVVELRKMCGALKMYTVFAMKETLLESYENIRDSIEDEEVCARFHCMVKDYEKAEIFKKEMEKALTERNEGNVKIRKFETFGGYDWLMEADQISIYSIFEHYKMDNLLTHTNKAYNEAFFNVESEILILEGEGDAGLDRKTDRTDE